MTPRTRASRLAGLIGIIVAAALVLVGSRLASAPSPDAAGPASGGVVIGATPSGGTLPAGERVAFWEARIASGGSYLDRLFLADAYLDRVRLSGDLADLDRATLALEQAAADAPDPAPVRSRQARVAFALHDFAAAAGIADELLAADPDDLAALSIAGDARLELGDLEESRALYRRLAARAPSAAASVRLARIAFLEGDLAGARRLVADAVTEAEGEGRADEVAFYRAYAAELARADGDLGAAAELYVSALDAVPEYAPALAGLGRVREAQGRRSEAIELLERSTAILPQPETVAALGDLYQLDGDADRAERQYELVERMGALAAASGSLYDRQLVLFAADHGRDPAAAVARAEAELAVRSDVYGFDALAWALFADGRLDEAADAVERALALGTPDARIRYHAGVIAGAQGRFAEARELLEAARSGASLLPPLQAVRLDEALARLGGEVHP